MSGAFLNRVQLIGNLGADPEQRSFASGGSVVTLRLATTESYRDSRGEKVERTEWHLVAVWPDGLQRVVLDYARKGSRVMVEGKLRTRKWQDQSGADRYTTEVHVTPYDGRVLLLDGVRREHAGDGPDSGEVAPDARASRGARGGNGGGWDSKPRAGADLDDDPIPF